MGNVQNVLGWGIIGTPKGRQASGDGLDRQLKLANSYDLPQEFCSYLPSPTLRDFTPLYCLQLIQKNEIPVLSIAEYRPIFEQGQTRAGSYFGAFIETANYAFGENSVQALFESLFELSSYQSTHFIDQENTRYKESISGKSFDTPNRVNEIATDLTTLNPNLLSQTVARSAAYIQANAEGLIDVLKAILKEQLYYRYHQIFFSESVHIATKVSNKTTRLSAHSLIDSHLFVAPFRNEIGYLHQVLQQQMNLAKNANDELHHLKVNQDSIIQASIAQKEQEFQSIIDGYQKNEQIYKTNEQIYQQNEQHYQTQLEQKESELQKMQEKMHSVDLLIQFAQSIQSYHTNINSKLTTIEQKLSSKTQHSTKPEEKIVYRKNPLNIMLVGLVVLFFLLFISSVVYIYFFSGNDKLFSKISQKELETKYCLHINSKRNAIEKMNDCISFSDQEIKRLEEQLIQERKEIESLKSSSTIIEEGNYAIPDAKKTKKK